jgi:predicted dehydrogenase
MAVKWGVIGAGGHADRRFIPEMLKAAPNSELIAVMDVNPDALQRVVGKYQPRFAYDTEDALLANPEVDAVYIATPQNLHCQQVLLAAQRGKHVLCEKPLAVSLQEADKMMDACAKAAVKLGVDYNMRYHAYNLKAKELVGAGKLGTLVMGRGQLTCWYPPIPGAWRQDSRISHGGSLIDMGSHCIDLLEYIMGTQVRAVTGFQSRLVQPYDVEDASTILLEFANGAHGVVDNYFCVPDEAAKNFLEIYGSRGALLASGTIGQDPSGNLSSTLVQRERGYSANQVRDAEAAAETVQYQLEPQWTYGTIARLFAQAIEQGTEPQVGAEVGRHNLAIVLAAYEAVKTGKVVKL